jgi:hypothetical protein
MNRQKSQSDSTDSKQTIIIIKSLLQNKGNPYHKRSSRSVGISENLRTILRVNIDFIE